MPTKQWLAAALAVLTLCLAAPAARSETAWRFATGYAAENFHTRNLQWFADEVAQATGGKLRIEVHPNGSLFKQPDILGAVEAGKTSGGEFIMSGMAGKIALFGLDSIPFITDGYPEAQLLWDLSSRHAARELGRRGLRQLYAVPWPPQGLYSTKPLTRARDLKAMAFRVYNPATKRLAEIVGAEPVAVQVPELAAAFASGRLQAMISSSVTGVDIEAWKYLKYYYDLKAWNPKNVVVVGSAAFDSLDERSKAAVLQAALRAQDRGWKESEAQDRAARERLKAMGVQVVERPGMLREDFVLVSERLIRESLRGTGMAGIEIGIAFQTQKPQLQSAAAATAGR